MSAAEAEALRDFIARARLVPFVDRGSDFAGCDCYGLVRLLYAEVKGVLLPDLGGIAQGADLSPRAAEVAEACAGTWVEVPRPQAKALDVVLMRGIVAHEGHKASRPVHVGCMVNPGALIHIEEGVGVSLVELNHFRIRRRVDGFYRYSGVAA